MSKKILTVLLTVASVGIALSSPAGAQGVPPAPPPPETKKTVDAFAGRLAFAGSLTLPDGRAKPVKTKLTCAKAAGGKAVSCTEDGEVVGLGPMHGAYLVGYDTFTKRVHFMAMTSDEAVHDHPCTWKDEHVLACEPLKGGMNGQPITEEFSVSFDGGGAAIKATVILPDGGRMLVDIKGKRA